MCGRFTLSTPAEQVAELLRLDAAALAPRYNVAPTQTIFGVVACEAGRALVPFRWGLIPAWAKEMPTGARVNARIETVHEKPSFREAIAHRRCLIPADGFYEWEQGGGNKQPFHIRRRGNKLFAFAGVWERWRSPTDGRIIDSCAVLTTEAGDLTRHLHPRMPIILTGRRQFDYWLHDADAAHDFAPILDSLGRLDLELVPVGTRVNRVAVDDAECVAPAERLEQGTLF